MRKYIDIINENEDPYKYYSDDQISIMNVDVVKSIWWRLAPAMQRVLESAKLLGGEMLPENVPKIAKSIEDLEKNSKTMRPFFSNNEPYPNLAQIFPGLAELCQAVSLIGKYIDLPGRYEGEKPAILSQWEEVERNSRGTLFEEEIDKLSQYKDKFIPSNMNVEQFFIGCEKKYYKGIKELNKHWKIYDPKDLK